MNFLVLTPNCRYELDLEAKRIRRHVNGAPQPDAWRQYVDLMLPLHGRSFMAMWLGSNGRYNNRASFIGPVRGVVRMSDLGRKRIGWLELKESIFDCRQEAVTA